MMKRSPVRPSLLRRASLLLGLGLLLGASAQPATGQPGPGGPLVSGAACPPLGCQRRYVDPVQGSDANPGTPAHPWQTLTHAMQAAPPETVLILLPGRYLAQQKGGTESYPICMRPDVSIQGTSALNTVLDGAPGTPVLDFSPEACGGPPSDFSCVLVDGIAITGGGEGVRLYAELQSVRPTLANCFIYGNEIGIKLVAVDLGPDASQDDLDNNGYVEHRPRIVNCTIVENSVVGILDCTLPLGSHGEGEPAILNTLVHFNGLSDLEGVDGSDLIHTAFGSQHQASLSAIKPGKPAPISHVPLSGGSPPGYVADTLRDYRLGVGSPLIDQGTSAILVAPNQTVVSTSFPCGQLLFDLDGEGFGNPRREGAEIDIGADEHAQLIVFGYVPGTTAFRAPLSTALVLLDPRPPHAGPMSARLAVGDPGGLGYVRAWPASVPGAMPLGLATPPPAGRRGTFYLDPATLLPASPLVTLPPAGMPWALSLPAVPAPLRLNAQFLPQVPADAFTNLQSFVVE